MGKVIGFIKGIYAVILAAALLAPVAASAVTVTIVPPLSDPFQKLRLNGSPFIYPAAAPNLVVNGDFEQPFAGRFSGDGWATYTSVPGWTTTSGPGIELRRDVAGTAVEGPDHYFVELDSSGGFSTNSEMSQSIATQAGRLYGLAFDYSPRPGVDDLFGTNGIGVWWGNLYLGAVFASGLGLTDNAWTTIVAWNLPGTGGNVALRFAAVGRDDTFGGSIDNIRLTGVPLPPIVWLLGSSLLAWLGFSRRADR